MAEIKSGPGPSGSKACIVHLTCHLALEMQLLMTINGRTSPFGDFIFLLVFNA